MKKSLWLILITISLNAFGQNGITFEVEKLQRPKELLYTRPYNEIWKTLILEEAGLSNFEIEHKKIDFAYDILAKSKAPANLVSFGYNSFFNGMYEAYADHRPFVLSPDMIWLLISQGFARHVNSNPEKYRKYFVDFSGKLSLLADGNEITLDNPDSPWEKIFPQFTSQIEKCTGKKLLETLTSDFSTTTPIEKIASEITIMNAMKPYFEFVVIRMVCGIPEITLLGTPEDWQRVLDKTRELGNYDLRWWTYEMEPLLEEFVRASKGEVDKDFWRNMFKYHSQKKYGAPNIIDGWIVKFFPYDKDSKRNNLQELKGGGSLPEEILKVDVKYLEINGGYTKETNLELWAGFIGLEQDSVTFALKPKIGWMIKKKDVGQTGLLQKLESDNQPLDDFGPAIDLKIIVVPEILKELPEIYHLGLHFKDEVNIPDWLKSVKIGKLDIEGKISNAEKDRIISLFPNTVLKINKEEYNTGKNGWITISDSIPEAVLGMKEIWVLQIWNTENGDVFENLDKIKNIRIKILSLVNETSPKNIKKIRRLFPDTKLYIQGELVK